VRGVLVGAPGGAPLAPLPALDAAALPGDVIALEGPLGAGKTVLARGFGDGAAVPGRLVSPTFALVAIHEGGRIPVYHADLYRLDPGADLDDLGLDDTGDGALLVEWPDRAVGALPEDRLEIALAICGDARVATIRATGPRHARLLEVVGVRSR
jgi:tRNA threonylcarbamoyl adenosine modification protein YjeE